MDKTTGFAGFEHDVAWAQPPDGVEILESPDVAVSASDQVYVMTRNPAHPIMVFEDSGRYVTSFGQGVLTDRSHGITIGPDGCIYCADDGSHQITKFSLEGELLMTLHTDETPAAQWSGKPFNRPTQATVSPASGDIYVTDGYGNARMHRFSADGDYIQSWGEPGIDPGQFIVPHNVAIDASGRLFVADREALRIQIFEPDGKFVGMINNVHRPDGLCIGPDGNLYIAELTANLELLAKAPGIGHRLTVLTPEGELVGRFGDPMEGEGVGHFVAPHGIAVNSQGDIYVSEVSFTIRGRYLDPPRYPQTITKVKNSKG